jgi:hypothetical protein
VSAVELDLDAIRARVDNATEGPWVAHSGYVETVPEFDLHRFDIMGETISQSAESRDAEFIAHARTDVPALLAEVERLRNAACDLLDEGLRQKRRANEARAALADMVPAARLAEVEAKVARVEALIEMGSVFLNRDTKIKRVQEDRRRDLGAIVTTSMVAVDDVRAALLPEADNR